MAYFSNYYSSLKSIRDNVVEDVKSVEDDDRLVASMLNFAKEVSQLMHVAANNSWIESKASAAPETESSEDNG